jgi:hypothetical protein
MYYYLFLDKPWIISDVLSICVMGSLIKLFKVNSLKSGLEFLVPYLLINLIFCVYLILDVS